MIVTVTGANGFIGYHMVKDQLAKGRTVRAVDIYTEQLEKLPADSALEIIKSDVRDKEKMAAAVKDATYVFHIAAAHLSVATPEKEYWSINRDGSRDLAELCFKAGVKRFILCSSIGVYGKITNPPANEETDCAPGIVYEKTKLAGEKAVMEYAESSGLAVVTVRPVWVYGPGCPRTEKLFRSLKKRRFFFVGSGKALRHCIHISSMIDAFNLCAEHEKAAGKTYIIGDHQAVTIRELMNEMAAASSAPVPRITISLLIAAPLFTVVGLLFSLLGKEPPVSHRSLKFFTNNTSFDISKARQELGFEPKLSLKQGLQETFAEIMGN